MSRDDKTPVPDAIRAAAQGRADVELIGEVARPLLDDLLDQLGKVRSSEGDLVVALTTLGGDADLARRFVLEVEQARRRCSGRLLFLGKSIVYSAGITIMSAFPPADRYLTRDCRLLIHGRTLARTVQLDGPIRASRARVEVLLSEMDEGLALEEEGFRRLVDGSSIRFDEVVEKSRSNWYLAAEEACARGLVAGIA